MCMHLALKIIFFGNVQFAGPDFWGLVNPDWNLCSRGQHQSPVDIDPERLLYDPHLPPLRIDRQKVRTSVLFLEFFS